MTDLLRASFAKFLAWCGNNRQLLFVAAVLWSGSLLLALAWPLPGLEEAQIRQDSGLPETRALATLQSEELSAFLKNRRWGVSLEEIIERTANLDQRSVNPVLRQMGYVGLISSLASNEVVLLMPEGGTQRLTVGDSLPDGRELIAIDNNSLTLRDAQQITEVLLLFPELSPEMYEDPVKMEDVVDTLPQNQQ